MSEGLLTVLKFCFLALLYLFLFRVVRIVRLELKPVKAAVPMEAVAAAPPAPPSKKAAKQEKKEQRRERSGPALYLLEPESRNGESYPLTDEVTVGRGAGLRCRARRRHLRLAGARATLPARPRDVRGGSRLDATARS